MAEQVFLAVDLGASSGRHVAGRFDGDRLALEETHRFGNGPVSAAGHLYWDLLGLWHHVVEGLRASAGKFGGQIKSVGVCTWGVDFGLLGRGNELLGNPYCYRDSRTEGMLERALEIVPREEIFAYTGVQFLQINTLYQLLAMRLNSSPLLDVAESLLMVPDLFHWLLSGAKVNEMTEASTSQFFDPRRGNWSTDLFERLQLPTRILGPIVAPGTRIGPLLPAVQAASGLSGVEVVVPGSHDTASAVMGVPAASRPGAEPDWCYISSGTWSLMGVETPEPVITPQCRARNFTNEGGVGGTTRLLKNICGLWMVQECRRSWNQAGGAYSWDDLNNLSAASPPLAALVDVDESRFLAPADMPKAIRDYCSRTGQSPPASVGAVVRCTLESLAMRYRQVLGWIEELVGRRIETIHIVGGGAQNRALCQMTADACRRRVVAGPVEATAIGNIMMQAVSAGAVGSIAEAREAIRRSFPVVEYHPQNCDPWDEAYQRFLAIIGGQK
jgi:rhamnulokinase